MGPGEERILVTVPNRCVRAIFQRRQPWRERDGATFLFHLFDLAIHSAKPFLLSVFVSELDGATHDLNSVQADIALMNTIRIHLDRGTIALDRPLPDDTYTEVPLLLGRDHLADEEEIRTFISNKCYWIGYKVAENPRFAPVDLTEALDLAYLGATQADIDRATWLLVEQGHLRETNLPGNVLVTPQLIKQYESKSKWAERPNVRLQDLPGQQPLLEAIAKLLESKRLVSLVFIDLDNFKAVNDALKSHEAGNRCLESVVSIFGRIVAAKGKLYRHSGDEFVFVLPDFDTAEATATAERIRAAVASENPGVLSR